MKLLRYGPDGHEKPGMVDSGGRIRDLSTLIADIGGPALSSASLQRLCATDPESLPVVAGSARIGACIGGVGKIVCVGLNYRDHAHEAGMQIPQEPVLFMKAVSSLCSSTDDVVLPRQSEKGDWEVELGIVIGTKAQYVSPEEALNYVAGYCIVNDLSDRGFQLERGGQWSKGKSADTFCPIGPWLVTTDEVRDPQRLDLVCEVSGETMQNGSTSNMVFGCAHLVSYISQFMTLHAGDLIATGTPAGVGYGRKRFLRPGDTLRLSISGLGEQRSRVVAYERTRALEEAKVGELTV